ncbi:MAG: APC family permease [Fuerstiella sp.]|nr:APC family permease [Fuerstiella sp.]
MSESASASASHLPKEHDGQLGELASTAICGNDITSSCLYVSALAIGYAGKLAPVSLLMVAAVLFLFRSIYAEVVGALPLNGGAYNALLNTTSKFRASIAACLTVLSYMATAVISALEAMHYVEHISHGFPVFYATIVLLGFFMVLSIIGITESAVLAIFIFITHIATLTLLLIVGVVHVAGTGTDTFVANMNEPLPSLSVGKSNTVESDADTATADTDTVGAEVRREGGSLWMALFFGFSAAMLGISGFESSSNFVEEQKAGVFPKTLRNMWIAVSFFNPLMALLALALVSISAVSEHQTALLAHLGEVAGGKSFGPKLSFLISVDAALVLSGAVLTSFVGVTGLVHRMTLDRCLPQFLLKTNRRGTTHRIIIGFFLLCVSVLFITKTANDQDQIKKLAGIYTISFLAVMALFALGNILLKIKRKNLPRAIQAKWGSVIIAMCAVLTGLVGNSLIDPGYLVTFLQYFIPAMLVIAVMLARIALLKAFLSMVRSFTASIVGPMTRLTKAVREKIEEINAQQIVFFTRGDNIANLNNALLYVRQNEHTNRLKIVTITNDDVAVPENLVQELEFLDQAYPEIDVEFVQLAGQFSPELILRLSEEWNIPRNLMFIGSPGGRLPYDLGELGGVRLII